MWKGLCLASSLVLSWQDMDELRTSSPRLSSSSTVWSIVSACTWQPEIWAQPRRSARGPWISWSTSWVRYRSFGLIRWLMPLKICRKMLWGKCWPHMRGPRWRCWKLTWNMPRAISAKPWSSCLFVDFTLPLLGMPTKASMMTWMIISLLIFIQHRMTHALRCSSTTWAVCTSWCTSQIWLHITSARRCQNRSPCHRIPAKQRLETNRCSSRPERGWPSRAMQPPCTGWTDGLRSLSMWGCSSCWPADHLRHPSALNNAFRSSAIGPGCGFGSPNAALNSIGSLTSQVTKMHKMAPFSHGIAANPPMASSPPEVPSVGPWGQPLLDQGSPSWLAGLRALASIAGCWWWWTRATWWERCQEKMWREQVLRVLHQHRKVVQMRWWLTPWWLQPCAWRMYWSLLSPRSVLTQTELLANP